jgi:hypothetical protein
MKMALANVTTVKAFSKFVLANTFPKVLSTKIAKNIHKIILMVFGLKKERIYPPFCNNRKIKNKFIKIESVSKTYISSLVVKRPPQAIS